MDDLYDTWLAGLDAEAEMERLAGYGVGWLLLDAGLLDEAQAEFIKADQYCGERGWRLPVQVRWSAEIKRRILIEHLRNRAKTPVPC